ncbi:Protein NRT1/ PTR FAMILY 2.7 [Dichanthelium oligosanthes]|uniref:Protein NRT1/ PTR FAMILY 2.7 n=1 Tax=Dichanthelium oligosanthes TaxID=888268 RepID=A0A1E5VVG2_9POAL|nr:Protein NRT1/ PTR FAMILY 2.7 [Dichanthelium oligosanthes]
MAMSATSSNLIVYLIKKYNVKSIDAAQISNIVRGCMQLAPVLGAAVSDAYFGCYPVVAAGVAISLLSFVLFTLTTTFPSLLPPPCAASPPTPCQPPSAIQATVLYAAVCLLAVGNGGTRYNAATLGADQFVGGEERRRGRDAFFSWYFVFLYASYMAGDTVLVYLQDSVSWALGFGVCAVTTGLGLGALVAGSRFLNRAAMIAAGETDPHDGSVAKPWRLCTVQEVEDLKSLVRVLPLWSSGILVSMTVNVQVSLTVLQALTMDRALGPRFAVPAASMTVTVLAAFVLFAALFDRLVTPCWERLTGGRKLTPLQRVGLGHALNVASMAVAALVERRRIRVARAHAHPASSSGSAGSAAAAALPMSALWLVAQLALTGAEEALHLPGNTALFYQEFPATLRSTATAMPPLFIAVGSYLSTAFVDVVRRATGWLSDDLNRSRLDRVYWTLALVAAVNFGYFLVCAITYHYSNAVDDEGKANQILDDK